MDPKNRKTGRTFRQDMQAAEREIKRVFESDLPDFAEAAAQDIVDDSFANEQYQNGGKSSKWEGRKNDRESGKSRTDRRALLVQSGDMRDSTISTQARSLGDRSAEIVITSNKQVGKWNLAQIHNEGFAPVPRRQFMPEPGEENEELTARLGDFMDREMDRIFK